MRDGEESEREMINNWIVIVYGFCFFFFKQKTAYEIGTGDWSSDVCSSDLNIFFHDFFYPKP